MPCASTSVPMFPCVAKGLCSCDHLRDSEREKSRVVCMALGNHRLLLRRAQEGLIWTRSRADRPGGDVMGSEGRGRSLAEEYRSLQVQDKARRRVSGASVLLVPAEGTQPLNTLASDL